MLFRSLDRAKLLGVRLRGPPHADALCCEAVRVDGRRHGREVDGGLENGEVGEDAAGGEAEEVAALLLDALVEARRGLFKLAEEPLEEAGVPSSSPSPSAEKGGTSVPKRSATVRAWLTKFGAPQFFFLQIPPPGGSPF